MDCLVHKVGDIPDSIVQAAIDMMEREEGCRVVEITIRWTDNPDEYGITLVFETVLFQRIRQITGYLVGDLNRFNNAKAQEARDRVKHTT